MAEESKQSPAEKKPAAAKPAAAKPAAAKPTAAGKKPATGRAKKEKKPEKPFAQAIAEDVIPGTIAAFKSRGIDDLELVFEDNTLAGKFKGGQRKFNILFSDADLNASKGFTCTTGDAPVSTIESFMIDERKVTPELLVLYISQRLYAQQWV